MKKIILIITMLGFYLCINAQDKIFDYVSPGEFQVGFKVIQSYDYSRTFGPKIIEDGVMNNNARPIQILVWYPSQESGEKLKYRNYLELTLSEVNFNQVSKERKDMFIQQHKQAYLRHGADENSMNALINQECYSVYDSKAAQGKFPLVVYSPGGNERCFENFVLAEYLASNGYIVAAIALTGSESQLMDFDQSDYELSVDDISFVISHMHDFPNVDNSKLGLVGFCYGSMVNFMVANRNSNVDVIVDLYGANNIQNTRDNVESYRYTKLKNPKMAYLQIAGSEEERDSYTFDNYLYGDAYQVRFENVSHNAFTSKYVSSYYYFNGKLPGGHSAEYKDTVKSCYTNSCKLTLEMFNSYMKDNAQALSNFKNSPKIDSKYNYTFQKHNAEQLPPYPLKFIEICRNDGVKQAKEIYSKVRSKDKNWKLFAENQMIRLGYQLLAQNKIEDAIDIFTMIVKDDPNSWNGYDSLGEACYKLGKKEEAIWNYNKSLELNPQNANALKMLKEIKSNT